MFKPGIAALFAEPPRGNKLRVAAVTNYTGRDRQGRHLVELLAEHAAFELVKIFTPEHGFCSDAPDGEPVADSHHPELSVPVISLYGPNKKPSAEMLKDLDVLIYDIQDVGVRFYTYISSLRNIMAAADEQGLEVWVLDRPDVLGGIEVEGPLLDENFSSFVGHLPVPVRYGLTPGELALWWKDYAGLKLELRIFACQNYVCSNSAPYPDFPWYQPSPSMPDVDTAQFYPGTCIFEGTQLSEGRGTNMPFRKIGAPWVDAKKWLAALHDLLPQDICASCCSFRPTFSKYADEVCNGIQLLSKKSMVKDAFLIGVTVLYSLLQTHPDQVDFTSRPGLTHPFFDYLCGTDRIRQGLLQGLKPNEILKATAKETRQFKEKREKFFIYDRK